jgi:hypothetical protein
MTFSRSESALRSRRSARHLAAVFLDRRARRVHELIGLVARADEFVEFLVVFLVRLGVAHHALDLFLVRARTGLDLDALFLAGLLVLGVHVQDAVGVDVERDFDLRHAARRRVDAGQVELRQRLVCARRSRSPCSTCTVTAVWLSSAVENTCVFLVGIVVFFSISLVMTPPSVSMPSDSGVTSSSSTSLTVPPSTPPWIAAPTRRLRPD